MLKVFPTTKKCFSLLPPSHFLRGFESDKDLRRKKCEKPSKCKWKSRSLFTFCTRYRTSTYRYMEFTWSIRRSTQTAMCISRWASPIFPHDVRLIKKYPEVEAIRLTQNFFDSGSEGTPSVIAISSCDTWKQEKKWLRKISRAVVKSKARRDSPWHGAGW